MISFKVMNWVGRFLKIKRTLLHAWILIGLSFVSAEELTFDEQAELMGAIQSGDYDTVIRMTDRLEDDSKWWRARVGAMQRRGEERFFGADIDGSIDDFNAFLKMKPQEDPHHWQRGLSYYYAGEYEKGKAQFERHQTVNTQDVENAVWHFLCSVRAPGGSLRLARKRFIPIERDSRVPMKEVHDLFGGWGSIEAVLKAAQPQDSDNLSERERNHLCYANFYLALYFEAIGETEKMKKHIRLAAFDYAMEHYMGRTAQVHAKLREVKED